MTEPADGGARRRGAAKLVIWLMRRFAPKHAEAAERESREWFFVCSTCGTARSYAELGAIRYGARSKGKRARLTCPTCGVKRWHKIERLLSPPTGARPPSG